MFFELLMIGIDKQLFIELALYGALALAITFVVGLIGGLL